jgi:hypothetical protein
VDEGILRPLISNFMGLEQQTADNFVGRPAEGGITPTVRRSTSSIIIGSSILSAKGACPPLMNYDGRRGCASGADILSACLIWIKRG